MELLASQIFGKSLKIRLVSILIGGFEYCMDRNGVRLIWQFRYRSDLPNYQIKVTAKYTMYTISYAKTPSV